LGEHACDPGRKLVDVQALLACNAINPKNDVHDKWRKWPRRVSACIECNPSEK